MKRPLLRHYPTPRAGDRVAMLATEATREARKAGTIADVFTTLGPNDDVAPLPARFSTIKKDVLRDMGVAPDVLQLAWKRVLKALEPRVQEIISQGGNVSFFFPLCVTWVGILNILWRLFHVFHTKRLRLVYQKVKQTRFERGAS